MQILTHPNNKALIESISPKLEEKEYHPIHYNPNGLGRIPIIFDELIPETKPSKDHFEDVEKNRFCAHSTYKPKDWEIYFGFVRALPEPNFIMMDDHRSSVTHKIWRDLECSSNLPTTVYAKEQETPVRPSVSSLTLEAYKKQFAQLRNSIVMHGTS
jgi:hypothetical protein